MTCAVLVLRTTTLSAQFVAAMPAPEFVNRQLTVTTEPGSQPVAGVVLRLSTSKSGYGASAALTLVFEELFASLLSAMPFCASAVTVTCNVPTLFVPSGRVTANCRSRVPLATIGPLPASGSS